jgi:hypothetical protein
LRSPSRVNGQAQSPDSEHPFGYDLRKGVSSYSQIVGLIGGFVVTAVALIFSIAAQRKSGHPVEHALLLGRATALLVLGFISCFVGAFALASIGAERRLTPNLTAATLYAGVCTSIGIVSIFAAFEVLAAIYLSQTKELFALITAGAGVTASVMVAFVLGDAWITPQPPGHWLAERTKAALWAIGLGVAGAVVVLAATALYFSSDRVDVSVDGLHWFIGVGIALVLASGLGSMFRAMHSVDGTGRAIWHTEAFVALALMNAYIGLCLLIMP